MKTLLIRQESAEAGNRFVVQRVHAGAHRAAPAVQLQDPLSIVLGGTDYRLGDELRWYLESYLDYPFGPNQQRAERVLSALQAWGREAFEALFGQGQARDFYRDATRSGHTELHILVASDDARVLAWPWEALHDPQVGDLAQHCRIERQLDHVGAPPPLSEGLSQERIGILLVTARPLQEDVAYRSISRPLVELIHQGGLPAEVKILRPPTFEALRSELRDHPGAYHIVHFDGHGGFGQVTPAGAHMFKGPQGQLLFEKDDGTQQPITGAQLSQLLREHRIPIAVLNACQSAMLGAGAEDEDAFASVATALVKAGVRSVVAMGYSLYVSAAREFLPPFYRRLFETGNVAEATRAGRQALLARPERRPGFELQDWLVPVLYQQDPPELKFDVKARTEAHHDGEPGIPEGARLDAAQAPHGVIGRDSAVLALERASRRAPAGLLLHGLGGVGKTTLARGYIEWLARTQGLPQKVIWQSFADVRSFDYVRNRLVEELFGANAMALPEAQKWPNLLQHLKRHPVLVVWDNFESASGTADADDADADSADGADGAMPGLDRQALKDWLEQLRGSPTKVLITSRSGEAWLGTTACYRIALGGLQGEERLALAQAILADQGIVLDPKDQEAADLIDSLQGHPLMMRAILPRLATTKADQLRRDFEQYMPQAQSSDPVEQRLYATLRYVEEGLPRKFTPLLYPIGLHEGHVDAGHLAEMARQANEPYTVDQARQALERLEVAGLVRGLGNVIFELHPALERYLRARATAFVQGADQARSWDSAFVEVMAKLASSVAPKALHEQRPFFRLFGGCIERALKLARGGDKFKQYGALMQVLAAYAQNHYNLPLAQARYKALAQHCEAYGQQGFAAGAYHQLGTVVEQRRDFDAAEAWYCKSLEIEERQGNEQGAACSYGQLGNLALTRRDFDAAEAWYRKSMEIMERQGNEHGMATVYHQLGMVAEERRDFDTAEAWYRKSLEIEERQGNEHGAANTYHQLGISAQERRDYNAAEAWYRKSLEISERQGNEHVAANTYHQLGIVAGKRRDFDAAEAWYRKSLEIDERQGNEHGAASTYLELGIVAQERRDFDTAEAWYRKSLEINERQGDEHVAALTYHQLGMVAEKRRDFDAAEAWYRKSLEINERQGDEHRAAITRRAIEGLRNRG